MKTDRELQRDVLDQLKWEPVVNANAIGVAVRGGVVTLTGYVDCYAAKSHAEQAVKRVSEVRGLAEEIEVRLPGFSECTDEDMARTAADLLDWTASVSKDRVKVTVDNRWATLDGEVDSIREKTAAESVVASVNCLRGYTSCITVRRRVNAQGVKLYTENDLKHIKVRDSRTQGNPSRDRQFNEGTPSNSGREGPFVGGARGGRVGCLGSTGDNLR